MKAADRAWVSKEEELRTRLAEKIREETQSQIFMGTEGRRLKFQVVTYNVAELTKPDGADLTPILGLEDKPDVISIGLEESGDFDILPDEEHKQDPWCKNFDRLLHGHGYYVIDLTSVFQIKLRVYIKKEHMKAVSHVEAVTAKSGFVGGVSNIFKGAATVRFRLYGKHVAVINCHLTAFHQRTLDRNTEFWQFFADQEFADPECEELYHHDYIIWSGDLNYRVNFDNLETRKMATDGRHLQLLQYDQLMITQKEGLAFVGFQEGEITFPPSYKFDIGTDIYDSSKKQRIPSWCDRVLFRAKLDRERAAHTVNWDPTLKELSDSDSVSSEISKSDELVVRPQKPKTKNSKLFKKKVMRKKDHCLRTEEMRRKTLGVLRKMYLTTSAEGAKCAADIDPDKKIELQLGDFNDSDQFQELLTKIDSNTKDVKSPIEVLKYKSYPEIMLSDHKPVAALLSILLPTQQGIRELVMKPVHQPWIKSKSMKLHIRHTGMGKLSPVTSGHWVGLYKSGWVNKASYFSWAYVQKKKKPKGGFDLKAKFGKSAHPKEGEAIEAVYFMSKNSSEPAAVITIKCGYFV